MKRFTKLFLIMFLISSLILTACSNNTVEEDVKLETGNVEEEKKPTEKIGDFKAETFSAGEFNSDEFKDYDLTMVNIWATWCGPCIAEMPDLQELKEMLPENMNMITICADAEENFDTAKEILEKNDASFDTLMPNEEIEAKFLSNIDAVPTSLFIDGEGNIVTSVVGAPNGDIAQAYLETMNSILSDLNE